MKYERNWGQLGMKSEWKIETLADVCKVVTDGSHYSPHSVQKGKYMVSVKDFTEYGFDFSQCRQISEQDYEKLQKGGCVPEYQDILVGKDGARYFEDIILYRQDERPALLSSIAILRCDESKIMPEFLYYLLKMPSVQKNVKENYGSGSAIPRIVLKDFRRMPVQYPDIKTQEAIVSILQCIDEKIQVNLRINKNLEQQVQAVFNEMFPDIFSFNTDATLQDLITFANGKKRPKTIGNIPVYGGNGILAYTDKSNADNCVIIGRVGAYCGNTFLCLDKCWISDNAIQAKSRTGSSPLFVYYLLRNASLSSRHIGTGQPLMTQGILNAIPIKNPTEEKISAFIEICTPVHMMISANRQQNESLASMRDSLLPELMSGEFDVSDIDI